MLTNYLRVTSQCKHAVLFLNRINHNTFYYLYQNVERITIKVKTSMKVLYLSYDVASGSEITPCNKIDKPLVVYRFTGNVMTSITTLRT